MKYITTVGEQEYTIVINEEGYITIDGERLEIDFQHLNNTPLYSLLVDGHSYDINIDEGEDLYHVTLNGTIYDAKVEDERTRRLAGLRGSVGEAVGEALIKAPMPGVVVNILVSEGQEVSKGDIVLILESMKMQNEFKSPKDGTVSKIKVKAGDKVDQNAIMMSIS